MRAGEKKHLRKKNIEPIFSKSYWERRNKKNFGNISVKVNEGDEIKKKIYFKKS